MNNYQKILTGAVLLLVVLNIALLGFIWKKSAAKAPGSNEFNRRERMSGHLKKVLKLDTLQLNTFRHLYAKHQKEMGVLNNEMRILNREIHQVIIENDSLAELAISQKMDSLHLLIKGERVGFVRSLSELCRDDQKEGLLQMLNELPDRRGFRGNRHSKKR